MLPFNPLIAANAHFSTKTLSNSKGFYSKLMIKIVTGILSSLLTRAICSTRLSLPSSSRRTWAACSSALSSCKERKKKTLKDV